MSSRKVQKAKVCKSVVWWCFYRLVFGILNGIPFCLLCFGEFSSFPRRNWGWRTGQRIRRSGLFPGKVFAYVIVCCHELQSRNSTLPQKQIAHPESIDGERNALNCMNFNMLNCQEIRSRFLMCFCDHCYCPSSLATVNSCIVSGIGLYLIVGLV